MSLNWVSRTIVGKPIDPGVRTQFEKRSGLLRKTIERTDEELQYLNANSIFISLTSAVDTPVETDPTKPNQQKFSSELAKTTILTNGTQGANGEDKRGGWNNNADNKHTTRGSRDKESAYDYDDIFGYKPMAGITSFQVESLNNYGTLRKAIVEFKVSSIDQLNDLDTLFFRPGYSVLLEWGHTIRLDNNGVVNTRATKISTNSFCESLGSKAILNEIEELKVKNSYGTDYMYGTILNFSWNYDNSGTYLCSITIMSLGSGLESLSVNNIRIEASYDALKNTGYFADNETATALHAYLYTIKNTPIDPTDSQSKVSDTIERNLSKYVKDIYNRVTNKQFTILKDNEYNRFRWNRYIHAQIAGTMGGTDMNQYTKYISLGELLGVINETCIFRVDKDELYFKFYCGDPEQCAQDDKSPTKFVTFPSHLALDPFIAILPKVKADVEDESLVFNLSYLAHDPDNGSTNDIINIMLNVDFVINCLNKHITSQDTTKESIRDFLMSILDALTYTMGEVNEFDLHYEEVENLFYVVDRKITPSKDNLSQSTLDLVGLGSFIENINLTSTISNDLTSMLAVSATANNSDVGQSALNLQMWNQGLQDRHIPVKIVDPVMVRTPKKLEEYCEVPDRNLSKVQAFVNTTNGAKALSTTIKGTALDYNVEYVKGLVPAHRQLMHQLYGNKIKEVKTNPGGMLPFQLTLTMKGISGLKIGQAFLISDDTFLPERYKGRVGFVISGISHRNEGNRWVTDLKTLMINVQDTPKVLPKISKKSYTEASTNTQYSEDEDYRVIGTCRYIWDPAKYTGNNGNLSDGELVDIGNGQKLSSAAAKAYKEMYAAASKDGIQWTINNSYRSYAQQLDMLNSFGLYSLGGKAACPGTSNHGLGKALDINTKSNPTAYNWLVKNAVRFNFKTVGGEPWHWEYFG